MIKTTLLTVFLALASATDLVVDLKKDTYDAFVKDEKLTLIEFYAPWCGHCKALVPEYEKAAAELAPLKLKIAKVDCTVETDVCASLDVKGYPTLKIFRDGVPSEYKGARTADSIVETMKKQFLPALSPLTDAASVKAFSTSSKVVLIGYFVSKDTKNFKTFEAYANKHRDDLVFGYSVDTSAAKSMDAVVPQVVLYKTFDEGKNVMTGDITQDNLDEFRKTNSVPTMDDLGPDNYADYVKIGKPIVYLFTDKDEDKKTIGGILETLAKKYKKELTFAYIDAVKYGGHGKTLNLKDSWPGIAIQDTVKQTKYPYEQSADKYTETALTSFFADFIAGNLEPSLKSEAVPADNTGPVKIVVGKNFDVVVMDKSKDVFLEIYAPWCGHCKKLTPIWEELGEHLKGSKVVIAKFDGTENDIPPSGGFSVEGFPTLKLFKAETNEVVDYDGDRTLDSLFTFLKENAVYKDTFDDMTPAAPGAEGAEDDHDEL